MNEKLSVIIGFVVFIGFAALFAGGCRSQPVVIDAGDFERLRHEIEQLRGEYAKLQSDYRQLTEDSHFYADYYRLATEAIESGLGELGSIGTDNLDIIGRLRTNNRILLGIVQQLIDYYPGATVGNNPAEGAQPP